jgi:molecular chaperone HtpG
VLAASAGPDLQMQRLLRRAGRDNFSLPPVLELNPRHRLIAHLATELTAGRSIDAQAQLMLDLARLQDGELPRDPASFARQVEAALIDSPRQENSVDPT